MLKKMPVSIALLLLPVAALAAQAGRHPTAREILDAFERGDLPAQATMRMMDKAFPKETLAQGERFAAAMRRGAPDAELQKLAQDVGYQISYGPRRYLRTAPDADLVALAEAEATSMDLLRERKPALCAHPDEVTKDDLRFYPLPMDAALVAAMVDGRDHPTQRPEASAEDRALLTDAIRRQALSAEVRVALGNLAAAPPAASCEAMAAEYRAFASLPPPVAARLMVGNLIMSEGA